jgi:hypothetical protein
MRVLFRFALFVTFCSTLQSCIGVGAWTLGSRVESSQTPRIFEKRGSVDLHKPAVDQGIKRGDELRRHWGEPDRVISLGAGQEEWTYKPGGWRWAGMLLYVVIVPLPAMVPIGSQEIAFTLMDGHIAQATKTDWGFKAGAYCGYFGMVYGGLACGTGTLDEAMEPRPGS